MTTADPYYETGPAAWIRARAEDYGVHVELGGYDLAYAGYSSPDGRTLIARPGLPLPTFLWLTACGVVGHRFGFEVIPDLVIGAGSVRRGHHLELITGGAR